MPMSNGRPAEPRCNVGAELSTWPGPLVGGIGQLGSATATATRAAAPPCRLRSRAVDLSSQIEDELIKASLVGGVGRRRGFRRACRGVVLRVDVLEDEVEVQDGTAGAEIHPRRAAGGD